MSTLQSSIERKHFFTGEVKLWTFVVLGCIAFASIYEYFSHGVNSVYMWGMFLFPLVIGLFPAVIRKVLGRKDPSLLIKKFWGFGITTLIVGSCLRGVLDIYGTTSTYIRIYWIAGIILLVIAVFLMCLNECLERK